MDQNKLKNLPHRFDNKAMNDPEMMMIDPNMMMIDPKSMTNYPKIRLIWANSLKIAGPTGMFGEGRDCKTMIREPFASDLAHMFDE